MIHILNKLKQVEEQLKNNRVMLVDSLSVPITAGIRACDTQGLAQVFIKSLTDYRLTDCIKIANLVRSQGRTFEEAVHEIMGAGI